MKTLFVLLSLLVVFETSADKLQQSSNELPTPGICGFSFQDTIYAGNLTKITDNPWMALLVYTNQNGQKNFNCEGVLINDQYVLSAGHCVKGIPSSWTLSGVRLGEWNIGTDLDCQEPTQDEPAVCSPPHKDLEISEKIPHADYDPLSTNKYHDIALLRLKEKVTYSKFIQPICLPVLADLKNKNHTGESLELSGWHISEMHSDIKLKVPLEGFSLEDCNKLYAKEGVTIKSGQICAKGVTGEDDACIGNSGGTLMAIDEVTDPFLPYYYLSGLFSFGPTPCRVEGWPGVYTKVSEYVDWIQSTIKA